MEEIRVRRADAADQPVLERLWLLCCHDMSEFNGHLPDPDGTFQSERLRTALDDETCDPYLLTVRERPAGLALVERSPGPAYELTAFFVVRGARRTGVGLTAVRQLVARHPGRWEVAFQDTNPAAGPFWRRAARELAGDAWTWTEERRPVPGCPDEPPDLWISLTAPT
ncbi:hypothetical protein GCM10009801_16730 [Streptomyces albiaxialis]|uniref:N-acetyltransferase domain-containing protein n=1 Tax=Streptomyces albiaxialis TaxID=329523 RepID=A0ABN2VPK1_9ACTN